VLFYVLLSGAIRVINEGVLFYCFGVVFVKNASIFFALADLFAVVEVCNSFGSLTHF